MKKKIILNLIERIDMLSKKIIIVLFIFIISTPTILIGCNKEYQKTIGENLVYEDSEIRIIELEEKNPPDIVSFEWIYFNEEKTIKMSDFIFKGTIVDKKEYVIEKVRSAEYTFKDYRTVYSVNIGDIYYTSDKETKVGDTVKVMIPINSYSYDPEALPIEKGQEFIFFAVLFEQNVSDVYTSLAKYYIGNPWRPIISVKEGSFKFDPLFESLAYNASIKERKVFNNYSLEILERRDENFISDLRNLISKYKNKLKG